LKLPGIVTEELIHIMEKIGNNKSAGPNFLRGEIYKQIGKGENWIKTMAICFFNGIKSKNVPERWKASRTKLNIKKEETYNKRF